MRADLLLVERGLARSRSQAASLIDAERVLVNGVVCRKPAQIVDDEIELKVLDATDFVSRAGHKLASALAEFGALEIVGKRCLDVGASTGGFTDVLLRNGAANVVAIDVGHDQMVPELAENTRVQSLEGFNARQLSATTLAESGVTETNFDLIVADLSFISLTLVLEQMLSVGPEADLVLLIKPQFEVGKQSLSARGIVNHHGLRARAIHQVVDAANDLGCGIRGLVRSALTGTHGNIEYVLWISSQEPQNSGQWTDRIDALAREGK
ncbi:MAG: TlyA family RNA methyltransferase [Microbacteriaceae bacterium]|nr:TlyA family RNA methyltransferase [Microbacteriaceae bacterium]